MPNYDQDEIIKAFVDLINTSPDHKAWYDPHALEFYGDGGGRIHIVGPLVSSGVFSIREGEGIVLEGSTIKIGPHHFDLNDPESIDRIEHLFGCNMEKRPEFDPIDLIKSMMDHYPANQ